MLATPVLAASSDWFSTEGARLRLITSGAPADGIIQGALLVELQPGWKTYWRDPGSSGVPPSVDVSKSVNIISADVSYPPPTRFDDESGAWVGYKHPVAFPIAFQTNDGGKPQIEADVFLGICQTICVPVQASLQLDPSQNADDADDAAILAEARDALAQQARDGFRAELAGSDGKMLTVVADIPAGAEGVTLFLAGTDDYMFGTPVKVDGGGRVTFTVPVLTAPAAKPAGRGLAYTLVTDKGSVDGFLLFP